MNISILEIGAKRFGTNASSLRLLGGFDQNVYECKLHKNLIIKFLSSENHSYTTIKAELNWMNYLSSNGLFIAKPIVSQMGNLIEEVQTDQDNYFVIAFEKAKGTIRQEIDHDFSLIHNWGKVMGKMHYLAKNYLQDQPDHYKHWNKEKIIVEYPENLGQIILKKWNWFLEELNKLPKDEQSYGLIHHDLHHQNFHVYKEEIIVFDFGDIEYHWFVYDIAISMYHAIQTIPSSDKRKKQEFASRFYETFIEGYLEENSLNKDWFSYIPFFLRYRQIYSYIYLLNYLKVDNAQPNILKALRNMKNNIENDIPVIDF
ncbi:phosphotransferase [Heyndrickxia sp. FSL W8-0496]|uniref:phosphotransferase enzyme family protein n=1 Tax=Heyndrickxia TaxID=2837504 RepID=UPI0030FB878C